MENVDKLVAILRNMGNKAEKTIELIEKENPELAKLVREKMFMFEDIEDLSRNEISILIREVSMKTLTLALKGTDMSFRAAIFNAVTKRVAENIKDDLEIMGPVKLSDVEKARGEILDAVNDLTARGLISKNDDDVYV